MRYFIVAVFIAISSVPAMARCVEWAQDRSGHMVCIKEQTVSRGRVNICVNRCTAKGWPKNCMPQCLHQWR